ncbi:Protein kri1 [Paramyrothecium foliicola]|nr:Protein kri1 [Paramyrothecium foliicola]
MCSGTGFSADPRKDKRRNDDEVPFAAGAGGSIWVLAVGRLSHNISNTYPPTCMRYLLATIKSAHTEKSKGSKRKLLDDSDSESDNGGAPLAEPGFKVNEEYARRFEHNKKREERHRLEEKYKKGGSGKPGEDDEDGSSSDETEDEDGFLATEDLDVQISATLQAIRNKDPRVYDSSVNFFQESADTPAASEKQKKEKPVYLRDYQREKILRGDVGASDDEEDAPQTYAQEQDALKKAIASEFKSAKEGQDSDSDSDDDGFMKRKAPAKTDANGVHPSRAAAVKVTDLNVAEADKNPENFLSNFLAARAWVAEGGPKWEAFESDEGEGDDKADEFEQAYNLRFEDPEKSNEFLKSYARDVAAARSVRREEKTGRKRRRDLEREKQEEEKKERREEKARLRKLKMEEAELKLKKIKQTAGTTGAKLTDEDWINFLNDAWDDDKWEQEMQKRFGEDYYAMADGAPVSDEEEGGDEGGGADEGRKKKKHPKKPKWDDDIDIKDIIPDFKDDEEKPDIALSDAEGEGEDEDAQDDDGDEDDRPSKKRKTADHKRERMEAKKKARQERSKLEALVDSKLELTNHDLLNNKRNGHGGFRYRETSPQAFGMTARDILLAPSDQVLNDFAGLKKLATFRDVEKKRRDKKHLGKKARLRQWRRDVFGAEFERTGPTYGFERVAGADDAADDQRPAGKVIAPNDGEDNIVGDVGGARKKKKRSKSKKGSKVEALS